MSATPWWTTAAAAFGMVFVAELGDKTQLTALAMASGGGHSRLAVFLGASLALCASTALAVLAAGWVRDHVDPRWVRWGAGALFIGFGLWTLFAPAEAGAT